MLQLHLFFFCGLGRYFQVFLFFFNSALFYHQILEMCLLKSNCSMVSFMSSACKIYLYTLIYRYTLYITYFICYYTIIPYHDAFPKHFVRRKSRGDKKSVGFFFHTGSMQLRSQLGYSFCITEGLFIGEYNLT